MISVFACLPIFDDLEEEDDDDNNDNNDTETPDPVQARIPSHPGIKYLVRGIPPSNEKSNKNTYSFLSYKES